MRGKAKLNEGQYKICGPFDWPPALSFVKSILVPGVLVLFRQDYVDTMSQAFWKGWDCQCGTQEYGTFDSAVTFLETTN